MKGKKINDAGSVLDGRQEIGLWELFLNGRGGKRKPEEERAGRGGLRRLGA